jgi:hypothetical protein
MNPAIVSTPSEREIRIEHILNAPREVALFHTVEDRDGMLHSGMEQGVNQSYAALDRVLTRVGGPSVVSASP